MDSCTDLSLIQTSNREDRRKTATVRSEIGRLSLIHARRNELYAALIDVIAQVQLEILLNAINQQTPFRRWNQRLGNIATAGNFAKHSFGQLVAPVGSFAAVACRWFEKPLFAARPE